MRWRGGMLLSGMLWRKGVGWMEMGQRHLTSILGVIPLFFFFLDEVLIRPIYISPYSCEITPGKNISQFVSSIHTENSADLKSKL